MTAVTQDRAAAGPGSPVTPSRGRPYGAGQGVTARQTRDLVVRYTLLIGVVVLLVGPFAWQLMTSLKGQGESIYTYPPQFIPQDPTLANYAAVAETIPVWRYIANSLVVATASAMTNCAFGAMAGYALARLHFIGSRVVYLTFLATIIIPFEVILVSVFLTSRSLGLVDSLAGVVLPTAVTGLSIVIMRTAFLALPREVEEAAVIDGAGEWQRFRRVAVPSARGSILVVALFSFVFAWDDFLWPLVVLQNPDNYTLTVGIEYLSGTFTSDQRVVAAGTMIAVIPLLVLFFALQRWFFRGVASGAVKG
jgi:ABC-type glycerol-3-phosphate transport system permease component